MPARRRTNLSRSTAEARRKRLLRASESLTQRVRRLEAQRERISSCRASETEEQRIERREADRRRKARYVAAKKEQLRAANRKRLTLLIETGSFDPDRPEEDEMRNSAVESAGQRGRRVRKAARGNERYQTGRNGSSQASVKKVRTGRKRDSIRRPAKCDPEVFMKIAVRQWLDKVKSQVFAACSRVPIKTEAADDGGGQFEEAFMVDEGVIPKIEPEKDGVHRVEEDKTSSADPVPKPTEVFVNCAVNECAVDSVVGDATVASDPLDVGGEAKPLALITLSEGGVLREEDNCALLRTRRSKTLSKKVKQEVEEGGATEETPCSTSDGSTTPSSNNHCGTTDTNTALPTTNVPRRTRVPAPPNKEKAQRRVEKRRAAQREYQRQRRASLRPYQRKVLREKERLYRQRLRAAQRLEATAKPEPQEISSSPSAESNIPRVSEDTAQEERVTVQLGGDESGVCSVLSGSLPSASDRLVSQLAQKRRADSVRDGFSKKTASDVERPMPRKISRLENFGVFVGRQLIEIRSMEVQSRVMKRIMDVLMEGGEEDDKLSFA